MFFINFFKKLNHYKNLFKMDQLLYIIITYYFTQKNFKFLYFNVNYKGVNSPT